MSRWIVNLLLVVLGVAALSSQAWGQCSKFGHSCYGGHGKRSEDQYPSSIDYAAANQVPALALKASQDDALTWDDSAPAVTNPEIVANVRNWLSVLGRRLRQRSSSQSASSASQSYGFLQ
nr:uncharacterized protein LOC113808829 [Penaeus vannamei]